MDDELNANPRFEILGHDNLRVFFLDHLNYIYCAKSHLFTGFTVTKQYLAPVIAPSEYPHLLKSYKAIERI